MKFKYVILGAGVSGLSFARTLRNMGETSFVILEKESEAGGLCRSTTVDGAPLDIGGGHILDVRRQNVLDFIFQYMPENEWNTFDRHTQIRLIDHEVGYPLESNIWQLPLSEQVEYLESIARAGSLQNQPMPDKFIDWIYWKLGDKIADNYMIPYNQKIWSCDLNDLGTYWLYKLPDVSFREVLTSCLSHAPCGTLPGHARFYYPKKHGYGEVFLRIADTLKDAIHYNTPAVKLDWQSKTVNGLYEAKWVINTIPWPELSTEFPSSVQVDIQQLKHTSIDIDYYPDDLQTDSHWTYFADIQLPYHRIIHRDNIAEGSRGYWTETNASRQNKLGLYHHRNEYAYPLNTINKPASISRVLDWAKQQGIIGVGRWGEWEHMNSDVAIDHSIHLAEKMMER